MPDDGCATAVAHSDVRAQELSISRAQAYRMARDGSLPYVMVGTRIRIPYAAVEKIAASNTAPEQQSVCDMKTLGEFRGLDLCARQPG